MKYTKIPSKYRVGGQEVEVRRPERCEDNAMGMCYLYAGRIEIAQKVNKDETQAESSKVNTFYHELVHSILDTMGEKELSANEKFVNCFSSFLCEAMDKAYFLEEEAK